jgi:hypothetical protein
MTDEQLTVASLSSQIKSLEAQLAMLKAQVERLRGSKEISTLGALRGLWAGQGDFSEEAIDACLYRVREDDDRAEGAPE